MKDDIKTVLTAAFERLKLDKPIHLPKGSKLTQANVIRETGRDPEQIKLTRYPTIQSLINDEKLLLKKKSEISSVKASRARRTLKAQLNDARSQSNKMASIIDAQNNYILDLKDELDRVKSGVVTFKSNRP